VEAGEEVRSSLPTWCQPNVRVQLCDLADLTSVQQAAHSMIMKKENIDLLVNNAGVMAPPRRMETAQGWELQFGTNHVGHHFLTRLLLPSMAEGGRIVTLASTAHTMGTLNFDNLNYDKDRPKRRMYTGWNAYGQSKLANILFAKGLNDKLKDSGSTIQSVSLHPGVISTNLWKYTPFFLKPLTGFIADKSPQQGAATSIFCSLVEPSAFSGGEYCSDCQIVQPNDMARDKDKHLRTKLWDETERLIAEAGFETPKKLK
jgi:NAD(P)-dependent dehydrogenase (short-subunit alcohol dehydrogenase family)